MVDRLERFINLIAKTGDKLIVYDRHNEDDSFVLVGLNEYERLFTEVSDVKDLTEDELIDRINRDIVFWKANQKNNDYPKTMANVSPFSVASEVRPNNQFTKKTTKGNHWTIPESRRHEADAINGEGQQFIEEPLF
jgi:hypothetical protein